MAAFEEPALELQRDAVRLAEEIDDVELKVGAWNALAYSLAVRGDVREALALTEQATAALAPADRNLGVHLFGYNLHAGVAWRRGIILSFMGRCAEAEYTLERAGELARERGDIEMLGSTHISRARLGYYVGDANRTRVHARQAMEIAERIGSSLLVLFSLADCARAHLLSGDWHDAVAAAERALAFTREQRAGLHYEPQLLTLLAEARLGLGEVGAARAAAEEALEVARRRSHRRGEIEAALGLGRVFLRADGARATDRVETALAAAATAIEETGLDVFTPFLHVERAALAQATGDEVTRQRELREAHRLFTAMGAPIRAEQVARELGSSAESPSGISSTSRT
jgi:adenylate cyclase